MTTKGPWRVRLSAPDINATITGFGGAHVATVWSGRKPNMATVQANATILAGALDLRAALALCYGALTEEGCTDRQRQAATRAAAKILDKTADK